MKRGLENVAHCIVDFEFAEVIRTLATLQGMCGMCRLAESGPPTSVALKVDDRWYHDDMVGGHHRVVRGCAIG